MGGLLAALMAFLSTPLGSAIGAEIPDLAGKLVGIWTKNGKLTPQEIADYVEAQWLDPDSLVHKAAVKK